MGTYSWIYTCWCAIIQVGIHAWIYAYVRVQHVYVGLYLCIEIGQMRFDFLVRVVVRRGPSETREYRLAQLSRFLQSMHTVLAASNSKRQITHNLSLFYAQVCGAQHCALQNQNQAKASMDSLLSH